MPTFIFAPGIKVYISASRMVAGKPIGLVDITQDLVEGTMVRRSDGISTFTFSISNPQRKYDSIFTPNDRIIVMMKRLAWVRVYTGLLNQVPLVTAWPMVVPLTSSCSLKRLQYWFWDANAAATQQMIRNALSAVASDTNNVDGGLTNVILTILDKVVGWPATKVHIGQIPPNWFDIAQRIAEDVDRLAEEGDLMSMEFRASLSGAGIIAGSTPEASGSDTGGSVPTGNNYNQATWANAFLTSIGKPKTTYNIRAVMSWERLECGHWQNQAHFNPLSTTQPMPGATNTGSQGNIKAYTSWQQGLEASKKTVQNGLYAGILAALAKGNNAQAVADAVNKSPWGTKIKSLVPASSAVASTSSTGTTDNTPHAGALASSTPGGTTGRSTSAKFAQEALKLVTDYPRIKYGPGAQNLPALLRNPPYELDCSSFVQSVYARTLGTLGSPAMPRTTQSQITWLNKNGKKLTADKAMKTAGALVYTADKNHVEISLGDGHRTVGAVGGGKFAGVHDWSKGSGVTAAEAGRGYIASASTKYFAVGYTVPSLTYAGQAPAATTAGDPAAAQADPHLASDLPGYNANDPIDKLFGNSSWAPSGGANNEMLLAEGLTGIRALLNDQPLLPYLMNLFNAQMRSFCSAPNGDLIAWFPDYYGLWGTAATMVIEPIELQDFTVMWSDDYFVTHQFTLAGSAQYLDVQSGDPATYFATGTNADIKTQTRGIANIDMPSVLWSLFGLKATQEEAKDFADYIYRRFGARPTYQEMPGLQGPRAEFFAAIYMFMRAWAYQYNADIPLTFMPELYPGMLVQIPKFNFQAYVTTVTHTFHFGQGGGFQTSVNIAAPARMPSAGQDNHDNVLFGLPLAGNYKPGRGTQNVDVFNVDLP